MTADLQKQDFSKIKEVVTAWSNIRQMLRSGDEGQLVPVVIPKSKRGFAWLSAAMFGLYVMLSSWFSGIPIIGDMFLLMGGLIFLGAIGSWIAGSRIEIEQGTTGILSRFGKIVHTLEPGPRWLFWPWEKVEFIVDTSTEIPYTAPVLASPTRENVPLKSIEFFLKFRITDPIAFVRNIGASNFDLVLSSVVQDAIRQRSRQVQTERAYDLRGSDVGDMQELLNRQLQRYGVQITGANIPDVQLPDQYQQHLATREQVSKELNAYEREWELNRKQRMDTLAMQIERTKKERDARKVQVRTAINKAREDVAKVLQERETEAQKVRWEIEARGRGQLKSAENEARALQHLGKAYQENQAVLQYELARRRLQVAEQLVQHAPRPVLVHTEGGESSALSTLMLARMLPDMVQPNGSHTPHPASPRSSEQQSRSQQFDQLLQRHLDRQSQDD
jgi:regulator of protease activity HflC (stomatin/prohibitin superfamily)